MPTPPMTDSNLRLDALVIAAHPDDAEISLGGTILRLTAAGLKVGVLDLTAGEMGSRGTGEDRAAEAAEASELLGLSLRINLGLPDGRVVAGVEEREKVAALLRAHRPDIVFAHSESDLHPDHVAAGRIAREAWYVCGLRRLAQQAGEEPSPRPRHLLRFMGHLAFEPTLVVDIGPVWERKMAAISAYSSQLTSDSDDGSHFLFGADIAERVETKARYFGELIGARHGEPLMHDGPVPLGQELCPAWGALLSWADVGDSPD
ncbi:MAG TPA: bacillithiol biosynthesis deacetylase BshB1 [Planctomycetes bacterium]|nr:bacillithiol biosynthesis deacetylase BshB1 [Planctomycetota bacterium]HIK60814.1 bacillithiol biosynthesis deacetylase BshB1 [Planctomycetota bacterium]